MSIRIINADVFEGLAQIEDESVHCVVTSPPYWGLRCYGADGQIGQEPTLAEHIEVLVRVFEEVRRVLRKDGTVFLNYGDAYASQGGNRDYGSSDEGVGRSSQPRFRPGSGRADGKVDERGQRNRDGVPPGHGLKPKDLCLIPHRLAIALQDSGWWVRSDIIWHKNNPMPESTKDRPTSAHEHVFLLTKSGTTLCWYHARAKEWAYDRPAPDYIWLNSETGKERDSEPRDMTGWRRKNLWEGRDYWYDADAVRETAEYGGQQLGIVRGQKRRAFAMGRAPSGNEVPGADANAPSCRNLRNVWTIPTAPFPEAHFATFPPALPELCIKAGCPPNGTVLDVFGGAGTTALVADRLGRDAVLIELNPEYCDMARKRIEGDAGMFAEFEGRAIMAAETMDAKQLESEER